jgi:anti-anti-sigma regulatory factor
MAIRITEILGSDLKATSPKDPGEQSEIVMNAADGPRVLKVEGTIHLKDAELLEQICSDLFHQTDRPVIIELSDTSFLDTSSASVLCRMKRQKGIEIRGLNLFNKKVIELSDASDSENIPNGPRSGCFH